RAAVSIRGMARGIVREVLDRICSALNKLGIPDPQVEILIQLEPAHLLKEGPWLDLPLAIIILQACGALPELPEHLHGKCVLIGELSSSGDVLRTSGLLSLACTAGPGHTLIVPAANQKECALIKAAPGHEGSIIYGVSTLEQVVNYFNGKQPLESA